MNCHRMKNYSYQEHTLNYFAQGISFVGSLSHLHDTLFWRQNIMKFVSKRTVRKMFFLYYALIKSSVSSIDEKV